MAKAENGFAHRKGAIAAARRVLGTDAVLDTEFEVFEVEGGRFDWKAVERKRAQRRTGGKANPFASKEDKGPTENEVANAEAAIDAHKKPVTDFGTITPEEAEAARKLSAKLKGAPLGPALTDPVLPTETVKEEAAAPLGAPLQDDHKPSAAASAFGAFANGQLGNGHEKRTEDKGGSKRTADKQATEKKVRAPAVIQNGVRQPSVGTTCRAVWDELDILRTEQKGTPPDSKQVKELAERLKWNANNASIEFYQWRKFNGIKGRTAKPAK